jgi:hypothetical protein
MMIAAKPTGADNDQVETCLHFFSLALQKSIRQC